MTTLGLGHTDGPAAEVKVGFRTGWLRYVGVAFGGASGMAIVLGVIEVVKAEPIQAFGLLDKWGPWFLVILVGLLVADRFLNGLQTTVTQNATLMAGALTSNAEAQGKTAEALTRLADQGGKQAEEVRMLAVFAAREFPGVYKRLDQQDMELQTHGELLREIAANVKRLGAGGSDGQ